MFLDRCVIKIKDGDTLFATLRLCRSGGGSGRGGRCANGRCGPLRLRLSCDREKHTKAKCCPQNLFHDCLSVPELLEGVYRTRNGPNPTPLGIGVSTRVSSGGSCRTIAL